MMKFQKVFILLLFTLAAQFGHAQFRFDQISSNEGLSHNTIRSIIQDRNGFIWIGTYYGINKYDGYTMQHYKFSNKPDGLSSNIILSLFEDTDGNIWAGTTHGGLNRINTKTGKVNVYFNDSHDVNYTKEITDIFQSKSGLMFIVHKEGIKVFKIADDGKLIYEKVITKMDQKKLGIKSIFSAKDGNHWMFTPGKESLLRKIDISLKNGSIQSIIQKTNIKNIHFEDGYLVNLLEFPKNTLWLISNELRLLKIQLNDDLQIIDKKQIDLTSKSENLTVKKYPKLSIELDKTNQLWIAGNDLLIKYNTVTGEFFKFKKSKHKKFTFKHLEDILVDNSNILWVGTLYNGLYKMDLENNTFLNSTDFLEKITFEQYPIMAISEDSNGNIWFGSQQDQGIMILKEDEIKKSLTQRSFKNWTSNFIKKDDNHIFYRIKRLMNDRNGNMWIGAKGGLSRLKYLNGSSKYDIKTYDINDKNGKKITNAAFAIEEDFEENIWVGYWMDGLVRMKFDKKNNSYSTTNYQFSKNKDNSLSNNYVRDILEDQNKNIWIGTIGGLNKVIKGSDGKVSFKRYLNNSDKKNSLSNNYILDLFESKSGDIYIGTLGGGLNKIEFKKNNELSFKHYSKIDGLPSDVIFQIREDLEGNLWMLHVREISRLNPKTGEITYFDNKDGFTIDEFKDNAMAFTNSGIMICGGLNGFSFFQPNKISTNEIKPQLAIEDFKLFNESIQPFEKVKNHIILQKGINETKKIVLPYYLNSLEFVFSSLHFSNPEKNKYKYILEGFTNKWQYSMGNERRFASYTNVPPGEYIFKVFGSNSSGIWTDKPREIEIIINSPWYYTPLAFLIYTLLLISFIFLVIRIRLNQIRLESRLALESALHEKADELNKMKLQFFTNISHELRTPLTLIIGPLQQIMQGNTNPEYLKKLNSIMYKNSVRLLKLINQLLDFRKVESGSMELLVQKGDLVYFVQEISNAFEEIAIEKDIKFLFLSKEDSIEAWFDNDKIEKILYNLLSNAFKFTPKGKSIKITIEKQKKDGKQCAIIKVIDYGIGISEDDLKNVFEQFYQSKKENSSIHVGYGLGLAYTKYLVEIHKGDIQIESKLHEGTTCTISIPVEKSSYEPKSIVESQLSQYDFKFTKKEIEDIKENEIGQHETIKSKEIEHDKETPTLLIVEDNSELRNYLYNYFNQNYIVITAENGEEGLAFATQYTPHIIISDLMMPKMDGIEMCKKIKTNIHTSHIPVIILTAKAGLENEKEGLETGADEFVLKPFNIEILKLRIENILKTKQQWIQKFQANMNIKSFKGLSNKLDQKFLEKAIGIIKKNIDNPEFTVEIFASEIALSRSALFKKLKSITGQSTTEFIRSIRLKKAIKFLKSGKYSITEVIFMVGFSDPKYFRTCFKKQFGVSPSQFVKSLK